MKRLFSFALALIMVFSVLGGSVQVVFADDDETVLVSSQTVTVTDLQEDHPDKTDPFAGYVDKEFTSVPTRSVVGGAAALQYDSDKAAYNKLASYIKKVASGKRSSTTFELKLEDFGVTKNKITAEDLGVARMAYKEDDGSICLTSSARDIMRNMLLCDVDRVIDQLLYDMPYEFYWFDKTRGYSYSYFNVSYDSNVNTGEYLYITGSIKISMTVSSDYALSGKQYTVDTSTGQSVQTSVANAKAIVSKYASRSDYEKILAYKEEICDLVSYNYDAVYDNVDYGDPWQLIWVFDGDYTTNVVCEGYAKAFQYLCQLSDFNSSDVGCVSVGGIMSVDGYGGGHMWNVLSMDDGINYLVDITNCDDDSIGGPDLLFLKGAYGNARDGYYIKCHGINVYYYYDSEMTSLYSSQTLTVSPYDYAQPPQEQPEILYSGSCVSGSCKWTLDDSGLFTVSGYGDASAFVRSDGGEWSEIRDLVLKVVTKDGVSTIGSGIFENCSMLKRVEIQSTRNIHINSRAFYGCTSLTEIRYPSTLWSIGDSAFAYTNLSSIELYKGLQSIGSKAFAGVPISEVYLPSSVTTISKDSFDTANGTKIYTYADSYAADCLASNGTEGDVSVPFFSPSASDLETHKIKGDDGTYYLSVSDYYGPGASLTLPSEIDGIEVKRIENDAFRNAAGLLEVRIPDGYTAIGHNAFSTCSDLDTIFIPASVTEIDQAFSEDNSALTIQCFRDSYADTWARENGFSVEYADDIDEIFWGHDVYPFEGQEPTCTEYGWTSGIYCFGCDDFIVEPELIPALGHDLIHHDGQEETCTEPGWQAYYTCSRCDYTTYTEIPAGHVLVHHDAKAPTCREPGWEAYDTCRRCDYTTYVELPIVDHAWVLTEWIWSDDHSAASAVFTCTAGLETQTVDADVSVIDRVITASVTGPDGIIYSESVQPPFITTQPQSIDVVSGEKTKLTIEAVNVEKYQWKVSTDKGATWTDTGKNSRSLSITVTATAWYKCVLTNSVGSTESDIAIVTKCTAPKVKTQPESQSVLAGSEVTLTAKGSGGGLNYQWYWRASDSDSWASIAGATENTYTFNAAEAGTYYQYRCRIKNVAGKVYTSAATVNSLLVPVVTTQPQDAAVVSGNTTKLTVKATGYKLSYQWYYRTSETASWTKISGATSKSYSFKVTNNGYQYRCKVSNAVGKVYSEFATITCCKKPTFSTQPASQNVVEGSEITLTIKASGRLLSYQWQISTDSGKTWKSVSGATGKSYTFNAAEAGTEYRYRCKAKNIAGTTYSSAATIGSYSVPTIDTQPVDKTVASGKTAKLKVAASGTKLSYQWYYRTSETASWTKVSGATSATYSFKVTKNGYQYRCRVYNAVGKVYTDAVTVTCCTTPTVKTQPESVTAASGSTASFTVKGSGRALSYQWQTNASGSWADIPDAIEATLTINVDNYASGNGFRCVLTNKAGTVNSKKATLTIVEAAEPQG